MDAAPEIIPDGLRAWFARKERVAVALSGGVDSGVLLAAAAHVLGPDNCLAMTAAPPYVRRSETQGAAALCRLLGVRHVAVPMPLVPEVATNPPLRCYACKKALFAALAARARQEGFFLLCDGSNADDLGDYRPGMRALAELGIASPWLACGLGKEEIRRTGRLLALPEELVEAPASPCLLTRLEHGMEVREELLRRIERAEDWLSAEVGGTCRVRCRANGAVRIELEAGRLPLLDEATRRARLDAAMRSCGWEHYTIDPNGYQRGNMNQHP